MDKQQHITFGQAPRIALWIGLLMLLTGLVIRYILGERGVNTLIPTLLGMPISMLGFVALEPEYASGAMRGVTALALLGVLLTFNVVPQLNAVLLGQPPIRQRHHPRDQRAHTCALRRPAVRLPDRIWPGLVQTTRGQNRQIDRICGCAAIR
jgi:hypothetical protein